MNATAARRLRTPHPRWFALAFAVLALLLALAGAVLAGPTEAAPGHAAPGAQNCARASLSAAPDRAGVVAAESSCTRPGSTLTGSRIAVGCCVAAKAGETIDPALVRFSQDSIKGTFKNGGSVDDLAAGLKSGAIKPGDVPPIRVVERDGNLFTLDNRRLEAFRRAGVPIRYRNATPDEAANEAFKFTTRNGGQSVRVRGG